MEILSAICLIIGPVLLYFKVKQLIKQDYSTPSSEWQKMIGDSSYNGKKHFINN